ncbi:YitT family protein [Halobacillus locisalis]|uniref:YitT family protein n=1 Tax=Halobacillus locisalis TaxID=220753 RepID=A0A838CSC4_9BACI|nr:YitT family protein [Halobacillus locisalis]MBA2174516.1 YitT family protein [Halobacillus locisalis]
MFTVEIKRILIVLLGAILNAVSLNLFLIEANVYASGFTGTAQLITSILTDFLGVPGISTGLILFILNIPVAILGWYKVGKGFTVYSVVSVAFTTLFLELIPVQQLSEDIILNAVFGGVIGGVGVGITLKWGASTGGLDIIAMVLSRMKDRPIGIYFLMINSAIIVVAGLLYEPENALYTLLTLYVTTRVIDAVHTRHEKLTAMIITTKAPELEKAIHAQMVRGITTLPAKGAFTQEDKNMLVMVITRYELYGLQHVISEVDPNAFTNIVQTTGIFGFFRKDDQ